MQLIEDTARPAAQAVPLIGFAEAGAGGYFDDGGFPVGKGWDEIPFPAVDDEHAYALEISGDSMEPAYRDGAVIIVSPAASIRRGDRVVVKTKDGEVMVKELKRRTVEVDRAALDQPAARRAHAADARRAVDRPHRLGEPVAASVDIALICVVEIVARQCRQTASSSREQSHASSSGSETFRRARALPALRAEGFAADAHWSYEGADGPDKWADLDRRQPRLLGRLPAIADRHRRDHQGAALPRSR